MLTEFCFLAALTLNEDERAVLRTEIDEWVKYFLPKLERESTRTEKCRLIASVERHEFGDYIMRQNGDSANSSATLELFLMMQKKNLKNSK